MSKKKLNSYFDTLFDRVHCLVLGGNAGVNTKKFAKNVSVSFAGGLSAFVLLFVASIIAARALGPEEYGKYSVFFSIAQITSLLFVLELDVSSLYFLSQKAVQKKKITSSIMLMFFINVVVFSLLAMSVYYFFELKNISLGVFVAALVMGLSFALKRMVDAFLRSQEKFMTQSILRFIEAFSVIVLMCVIFFYFERTAYIGYVASIVFGGVVFIFFGVLFLRDMITFHGWNTEQVNEIFRYNAYGLINAFVNGIVKNADKLVAATLLGLTAAGVYAVYFTASVTIGARVTQIFMNVFFPSVRNNVKDISAIYKKINKICIKLFVPFFLCASFCVAFIILLYGKAYEFVWLWIILGGLYIAVHFFASLYGWLLSSISQHGYKFYNTSFFYGAVAYGTVIAFALVSDTFSITTFFVALILYRMVSGVFCFFAIRNRV